MSRRLDSNSLLRLRFFVWLALMLMLCTVFFTRVVHQLNPETDILALLPSAEKDPVVDTALRLFSDQAGRKTLFLIGADTTDAANRAAEFGGKGSIFALKRWIVHYRSMLHFCQAQCRLSPRLRH